MLENTCSVLIFSLGIVQKACQFKATINKLAGVSNNNETVYLSILSQNLSRKYSFKNLQDNWNATNTFSFFGLDSEVLFDNLWSQELKQGACYVFGPLSVSYSLDFLFKEPKNASQHIKIKQPLAYTLVNVTHLLKGKRDRLPTWGIDWEEANFKTCKWTIIHPLIRKRKHKKIHKWELYTYLLLTEFKDHTVSYRLHSSTSIEVEQKGDIIKECS